MAHFKTSAVILQATDVAVRANFVRRDPAVAKASYQARRDIAQAVRSTGLLAQEANAAWRRAGQA